MHGENVGMGAGVGVKEKSIWNKKDARLLHRGCILRAFTRESRHHERKRVPKLRQTCPPRLA